MQKKVFVLWILSLCFLICGCNNSQQIQAEDFQCNEDNECISEEQTDITNNNTEEDNNIEEEIIPVAEKLEWDNQITISEWDIDSPSVPESDIFEAPIQE